MIYIATCVKNKGVTDYSDFEVVIRSFQNWARIANNIYLIGTEETHVQVRDRLLSSVRDMSVIFVTKVSTPAAWTGLSEDVSSWIKKFM